jgi:hypothetical protein
VPAPLLAIPRILLLGRTAKESRRFLNVPEAILGLRSRFPGVRVEYAEMMDMTPEEQMHTLATTSVLITTVGSASFRLIYLPDGATTILMGAPVVRLPPSFHHLPWELS